MERIVHGTYFFVQNQKVILRNLLSENKDDYFALYQQNSIFKKKMKKEEFRDFFEAQWKEEFGDDRLYISILEKDSGDYVGNILVYEQIKSRNPDMEKIAGRRNIVRYRL